jgi:CubicO group peptidase (beta-lactamase class C family)
MKRDTLFAIASMTKPVTGTAVMMLRDAGQLSVDDPVSKYIPELAALSATVTIKHILSHTSGMGEATPEEAAKAHTLKDLIPVFASKPLAFAPGSQWKYCQSGINTASRIVEVVSGQPFHEFLRQRLFSPLGMKDTTFYPNARQLARLVKLCRRDDATGKLSDAAVPALAPAFVERRNRPPLGNGGLFSTAEDYARFTRMILNNGEWKGRRYVSADSIRLMTSNHTGSLRAGFVPGSAFGLSFGIVREPQGVTAMLSPGTFGHGGAHGTQAWIDPVRRKAFILMIQRTGMRNGDASEMRRAFQQAAVEG